MRGWGDGQEVRAWSPGVIVCLDLLLQEPDDVVADEVVQVRAVFRAGGCRELAEDGADGDGDLVAVGGSFAVELGEVQEVQQEPSEVEPLPGRDALGGGADSVEVFRGKGGGAGWWCRVVGGCSRRWSWSLGLLFVEPGDEFGDLVVNFASLVGDVVLDVLGLVAVGVGPGREELSGLVGGEMADEDQVPGDAFETFESSAGDQDAQGEQLLDLLWG